MVPTFADWCAIDVVEDGRLQRVAVAHVDPEKVQLARSLEERYPSNPDAPRGTWHVLRTGKAELIPEITDEMLVASARDEEHMRIALDLQLRSAVVVPLIAHERVLGVMTWVAAESERRYTEGDLAFAEDVARRAAVAIDNAELHSETLAAAVRLQQAVLPDTMPDIAGWDVASHYDPSGRTDVGGDFYDAIRLVDGRLALFVGDVMGRGVEAAAAMAQMRAAVRAYTAIDPDPASVLGKLDRMFAQFPTDQLVTLVYLVVDPARDEILVANAGHPPPVLLRGDGSTEQLPDADGCPLGVLVQDRIAHTVPMVRRRHRAAVHRRPHRAPRRGHRHRTEEGPARAADARGRRPRGRARRPGGLAARAVTGRRRGRGGRPPYPLTPRRPQPGAG